MFRRISCAKRESPPHAWDENFGECVPILIESPTKLYADCSMDALLERIVFFAFNALRNKNKFHSSEKSEA